MRRNHGTLPVRAWVATLLLAGAAASGACGGDRAPSAPETASPPPTAPPTTPPTTSPPPPRGLWTLGATVGVPARFDLPESAGNLIATLGRPLSYQVRFLGAASGFAFSNGIITGTPAAPTVVRAVVDATNAAGVTATDTLTLVAFAPGLTTPSLPAALHAYSLARAPLPPHLAVLPGFPTGFVRPELDSAAQNPATDAGATLGRVLFYDTRLSVNDSVSCGSCHLQSRGFADSATFSRGVFGQRGTRRTMALAGLRLTIGNGFFWDERARTLEELALLPIENPTEMGVRVVDVVWKLRATSYYPALFEAAFGSRDITAPLVARALAQYLRSLNTTRSSFDGAFFNGGLIPTHAALPPDVREGEELFRTQGCASCHFSSVQMMGEGSNNGLDLVPADTGRGRGVFRAPSLRNVAVRPPFMHDGRFRTLAEVIEFYDSKVVEDGGADPRLRDRVTGKVKRLGLTATQRASLVAFLESLTDSTFLTAEKFSNPFR